MAVGAARGCDESLLGGQDPVRGEEVGSSHGVDTRTVGPPQRCRLGEAVVWASQRHRPGLQHLGDEQLNQLIELVGCDFGGSYVALRLGADMPALPGRTPLLHRLQYLLRCRCHPLRIYVRARDEIGLRAALIMVWTA